MADLSRRRNAHRGPRAGRRLSRIRLVRSFRFAWQGVQATWRAEPNFRIEVLILALVLLLALWLGASLAPLLLAGALVLALELVNTAVERAVDLVTLEHRPLAGLAKDASAGAVFVASTAAVLVGLLHLGPLLLARLGS